MLILNKKQSKRILEDVKEYWGADIKPDYVFLQDKEGKIFLANKDIERIDLSRLRMNSIGLYFAQQSEKELRLSIEGSQIIGPKAKKNILELNEEQAALWLKGEDLELEGDYPGFVLIKFRNDFLGTGKYKEGKILNFVPKARRLKEIIKNSAV